MNACTAPGGEETDDAQEYRMKNSLVVATHWRHDLSAPLPRPMKSGYAIHSIDA
jgi:hypothetical protein